MSKSFLSKFYNRDGFKKHKRPDSLTGREFLAKSVRSELFTVAMDARIEPDGTRVSGYHYRFEYSTVDVPYADELGLVDWKGPLRVFVIAAAKMAAMAIAERSIDAYSKPIGARRGLNMDQESDYLQQMVILDLNSDRFSSLPGCLWSMCVEYCGGDVDFSSVMPGLFSMKPVGGCDDDYQPRRTRILLGGDRGTARDVYVKANAVSHLLMAQAGVVNYVPDCHDLCFTDGTLGRVLNLPSRNPTFPNSTEAATHLQTFSLNLKVPSVGRRLLLTNFVSEDDEEDEYSLATMGVLTDYLDSMVISAEGGYEMKNFAGETVFVSWDRVQFSIMRRSGSYQICAMVPLLEFQKVERSEPIVDYSDPAITRLYQIAAEKSWVPVVGFDRTQDVTDFIVRHLMMDVGDGKKGRWVFTAYLGTVIARLFDCDAGLCDYLSPRQG